MASTAIALEQFSSAFLHSNWSSKKTLNAGELVGIPGTHGDEQTDPVQTEHFPRSKRLFLIFDRTFKVSSEVGRNLILIGILAAQVD